MTNSVELKNILKHIKIFKGVFPCDKIPIIKKFPSVIIVNTDKSNSSGKHWVSLYFKNKNTCEYFDSFGLPINNKYIKKYLIKLNYKKYVYNRIQFQKLNSKLCGYYVVAFVLCKNKNISLKKILDDDIDNFIIKNLI